VEKKQKQPGKKKKKITQTAPAGCCGAARKDAKKPSAAAAKGKAKPTVISAAVNDLNWYILSFGKKNPLYCTEQFLSR